MTPRFAVGGNPVTTVAPFFPGRFSVRLAFARPGRDTMILSGFLIEPSNFITSNANATAILLLDVGRLTTVFSVDQRGRGKGYTVDPDPKVLPTHKLTNAIRLTTHKDVRVQTNTLPGQKDAPPGDFTTVSMKGFIGLVASLRGDFATALKDFGLNNEDTNPPAQFISKELTVPVTVYWPCTLNGVVYTADMHIKYYAKASRFGKTPPLGVGSILKP